MNAKTPAPIRIKLYGLFSVTRRGYITQLILAAVLLAALLGIWMVRPSAQTQTVPGSGRVPTTAPGSHPIDNPGEKTPQLLWAQTFLSYLPVLVVIIALLYALEAYFVLRRFAREEAAQKAQQPDSTPRT